MNNELTLDPAFGITQADIDESRNWEGMALHAPRLPDNVRRAWKKAPCEALECLPGILPVWRQAQQVNPEDRTTAIYRFKPGLKVASPAPEFRDCEVVIRNGHYHVALPGGVTEPLATIHGRTDFDSVTYANASTSDLPYTSYLGKPVSVRLRNNV